MAETMPAGPNSTLSYDFSLVPLFDWLKLKAPPPQIGRCCIAGSLHYATTEPSSAAAVAGQRADTMLSSLGIASFLPAGGQKGAVCGGPRPRACSFSWPRSSLHFPCMQGRRHMPGPVPGGPVHGPGADTCLDRCMADRCTDQCADRCVSM